MLSGKNITIGVTGGIAAFKAAQLVSNLNAAGAQVRVIMTKAAQEFVQPLTLQTLSGHLVYTGLFDDTERSVRHIDLAAGSDLIVIAPATANIIGKIAGGIADDLLSTVITAAVCPVLICPAMNVHMYNNPVVQHNLNKLQTLGYHFVEPGIGRLACGTEGRGRLAELDLITTKISEILAIKKDMQEMNVVVTAGPTVEPVDPVRYLTNRSSGKMGYAIAAAAAQRGAKVYLISGPVALEPPPGTELIQVETAIEMRQVVLEKYPLADAVVMCAAVADYRPKTVAEQKIKKHESSLNIELEKNPDILEELGRLKQHQFLIGFAAETHDLEANAKAKVEKKNLDMLVANDVTMPGAGFSVDTNIAKLFYPGDRITTLPILDKSVLAQKILDEIPKKQHQTT
ncbi:MAG: bifunctional phosphopantothenoylcysteine decarboxylase/phosphopantothenate--cysteine ligase CoaBC [Peptococcaceae bacterium]|nr:bifunctional phosphopantothenoylcysteine decarboxylase/phosphopantothenate--cysteine ligase CoaBC [Peptococcaceae bacterium]